MRKTRRKARKPKRKKRKLRFNALRQTYIYTEGMGMQLIPNEWLLDGVREAGAESGTDTDTAYLQDGEEVPE